MPSGFGCYVGYMKIDNSYLLFIIACLPDDLEFSMRQLWHERNFRIAFAQVLGRAVPCRAGR